MSEQSTSSYVGHVANSQGTFWCSKQESYSLAGTLQIHGWTEGWTKYQDKGSDYNILCTPPSPSSWPYTFLLSVIHWLDGISTLTSLYLSDYLMYFWLLSPTHLCLPCFSFLLIHSNPSSLLYSSHPPPSSPPHTYSELWWVSICRDRDDDVHIIGSRTLLKLSLCLERERERGRRKKEGEKSERGGGSSSKMLHI